MLKMANNATTLLAGSIDSSATTLVIASGTEALFPVLAPGDWFPLVVTDENANREIMRCTARAGVSLTVQRGQEGTIARAFTAGARVDIRLTSAAITAMFARENHTGVQAMDTVDGLVAALAAAFSQVDSVTTRLNSAGIAVQMATLVDDWDDALLNGWFMSNTAAEHAPVAGVWWIGEVKCHNELWITQTLTGFTTAYELNSETYRRHKKNGTWTGWYKLAVAQAEQDARYLRLAGGEMASAAVIKFADEAGTKINYYGTDFGTGVEPGSLTTWAFGKHRWRMSGLGGPVAGELTLAGFELPAAPTLPNHAATKAYVDGLGLGVGQVWQDVLSSRSANTSYQNTTGKPISIYWRHTNNNGFQLQVSANNIDWVTVGRCGGNSGSSDGQFAIVPNDWYYKTTGGTAVEWSELR